MKNRKNYLLLIISTLMMILFVTASINAEEIHPGKSPEARSKAGVIQTKGSVRKPVITSVYNGKDGMYIKIKKRTDVYYYDVYRYCKETKEEEYVGEMSGDETLMLDTDVKYKWGKTYSYTVVAWDYFTDFSPRSSKMTAVRIPAVTYTYKSAKSASQIQLKWKSIANYSNYSGYEVQYAKSESNLKNKAGSYRVRTINDKKTMSQTLSGLSANTTYYIRIRAFKTIKAGDTWKKCYTPYTAIAKIKTYSKVTKYRALLIGNYNYPGTIDDLGGPGNDIRVMASVLGKYHFSTAKKANQGASQIMSSIKSAFSSAAPNDVSLFYYSGHGDVAGNMGYLVGTDYRGISMKELAEALKKIPGKVIVILDSCYSGNAIAKGNTSGQGEVPFEEAVVNAFAMADQSDGGAVAKNGELRNSKFLVLAAGAKNENTIDYADSAGRCGGLFTRYFVQGTGYTFPYVNSLGNIPSDTNYDKKISVKEMYTYTRRNVESASQRLHNADPRLPVQHVTCYPYGSTSIILKK